MGQRCSRDEFEWVHSDEPHASRRKEILAKHPEINNLMGVDEMLKWKVTAMVLTQFVLLWVVRDFNWWVIVLMAYFVGGVINHSLSLGIHEISHNIAFGHRNPLMNRFFGMFANLPIGVPTSVTFKKYHALHHKYQGDTSLDVDLPTEFEGRVFNTTGRKFLWLILQPLFYAVRPLLILPLPYSTLELINIVVQVAFDVTVLHFVGFKSLAYLIVGTLLATGCHPMAGHFVSEHFVFDDKFETYSYYGILNLLTFNVGHHVEHHDFPNIPGSRLPMVRKIAPEFYDHLPSHSSWVMVLWNFVFDPKIGPFARIRRKSKQSFEKIARSVNGERDE